MLPKKKQEPQVKRPSGKSRIFRCRCKNAWGGRKSSNTKGKERLKEKETKLETNKVAVIIRGRYTEAKRDRKKKKWLRLKSRMRIKTRPG